jgi:ubiquinol-cytochrome c reductase cytochrome c1 subunit
MKKLITILAACCIATSALASEEKLETVKVGIDVQTVERGVDAMMNNCHSCHNMKYIKYLDLVNFGIDKSKVDTWRGDQPMDAAMLAQMSENDSIQAYGKGT